MSPAAERAPADHLGSAFGWTEAQCASYQAKAGAFRGLVAAVDDAGVKAQVREGLGAATRAVFDRPPLSVAFMPGVHFQHVLAAIDEVGGHELVRALGRRSILLGPVNTMRPLIEGTLRLFGATPLGFYRNLPQIMRGQIRGMSFACEERGPEACDMIVRFEALTDLPARTWPYWEGVLSTSMTLCKVEGRCVATPFDDPRGNAARVACSWTSRA